MPSSIDMPLSHAATSATNTPMGFRRDRNWLVSFFMLPFKDTDHRASEENIQRQPHKQRAR